MIKRFILPALIAGAVFQIPAQANTVRIIGPSEDEVRAAQPEPAPGGASSRSSLNRYGPTGNNETLWSIASRYRPNNQVSVYQVIGAIHRANPMAFEQNNIHGLIPGSVLTMPTLAQIRREDVDTVRRRLEADQRRQVRQSAPPSPPAPRTTAPAPTVVAKAQPKPQVAVDEQQTEQASPKTTTAPAPAASESPAEVTTDKGGIPAKPAVLQAKLDASDVQMTKLVESNHVLRVRLAEMQHEVSALKDQITNDERLRDEILNFIQQQKSQPVEPVVAETSWVDDLVSNPWALAAASFIPGALIAGALAFFIMRRKEEDDEVKSLDSPQAQDPAIAAPPEPDAIAALDDDKTDTDDLFAVDDDALFDDPETSLFGPEHDDKQPEAPDDLLDLSAGSSDDFEIESGLTPSSISVKGDEEAIGLQDMERALDEIEQSAEPSSDEALAAMWEQSLQGDDDDNDSFDLADADPADDADKDIEDGLLDQSILDDLLGEAGDLPEADPAEPVPTTVEQPTAAEPAPAQEPEPSSQVADQDELDSLFDSVGQTQEPAPAAVEADAPEEQAQQAAVDQALADADALFAADEQALPEDELDALFDENSTALLDELVDEDELSDADIELEENSTALLDELMGEEDDPFNQADISLDENSTALLDELVAADAQDGRDDIAVDEAAEDEPALNPDDVVIDENSTDLLDDILEQQPPSSSQTTADGGEPAADEPTVQPSASESATSADTATAGTSFEDPEFESTEAHSEGAMQDADFPAVEESGFADALDDALHGQQADSPADVPEDDIDALLADVQDLVSEPEPEQPEPEQTLDAEPAAEAEPETDPELGLDALDEPETDAPLNPEDLPEFDEDAALAEAAADETPAEPAVEPVSEPAAPEQSEPAVAQPAPEPEQTLDAEPAAEADSETDPELGLDALDEPETDAPLNLDDLPEFDEDTALAEAVADETPAEPAAEPVSEPAAPEQSEPAVAQPAPEPEPEPEQTLDAEAESETDPELGLDALDEPETDASLNLEDLPEFDEDAALAEAVMDETPAEPASEPISETAPAQTELDPEQPAPEQTLDAAPTAEAESETDPELGLDAFDEPETDAPLNLEDLPEFDEDAALAEAAADETSAEPAAEPVSEPAAPEQSEPAQTPDAEPVSGGQPEPGAAPEAQTSQPEHSIHGVQDIAFETIDPASIAEFSEDDALQASFEEQMELDQYDAGWEAPDAEPEPASKPQPQPPQDNSQPPADMFDDELVDTAGLDMDALLSDPDDSFAGMDVATADSLLAEQAEARGAERAVAASESPETVPETAEAGQSPVSSAPQADDPVENATAVPPEQGEQDELDAERDQLWSSGFDDDALTAEAYPEEDAEIWRASNPEPELETEDWAEQPQMMIDDVAAFDPEMMLAEADSEVLTDEAGASELVTEPEPAPSYISIDELMKEMETEAPEEQEEQPLDLNVGLDEFPDVLNDVAEVDVDSQGEYASKLDLAKAYLEMNDREGAQGLLEEVAGHGDDKSRQEAQALLQKISR